MKERLRSQDRDTRYKRRLTIEVSKFKWILIAVEILSWFLSPFQSIEKTNNMTKPVDELLRQFNECFSDYPQLAQFDNVGVKKLNTSTARERTNG